MVAPSVLVLYAAEWAYHLPGHACLVMASETCLWHGLTEGGEEAITAQLVMTVNDGVMHGLEWLVWSCYAVALHLASWCTAQSSMQAAAAIWLAAPALCALAFILPCLNAQVSQCCACCDKLEEVLVQRLCIHVHSSVSLAAHCKVDLHSDCSAQQHEVSTRSQQPSRCQEHRVVCHLLRDHQDAHQPSS